MEEFEGYKVPECTEEEVRAILHDGDCPQDGGRYFEDCHEMRCHECLFEEFDKDITQRYLDHRYSQKIAVHCKTQEEWDRMRVKLFGRVDWKYDSKFPYFPTDASSHCASEAKDYTKNGYKIISAQEYLGEEKSGLTNHLVSHWKFDGIDDYISVSDKGTIFRNEGSVTMWNRLLTEEEIATLTGFILTNTKEEDMNNVIAEVYKDKTYEEVVMVNKHFGNIVADNLFGHILLETHKDEVFAEAEAHKKEEEEANKD